MGVKTGNPALALSGLSSLTGMLAKPPSPTGGITMQPSHTPAVVALPAPVAAGVSMPALLDVASKVGNVLQGVAAVKTISPAPVRRPTDAPSTPGAVRYPVTSDPSTFGSLGTDKVGRPIVAGVTYSARAKAPRGYVVVQHPTMGTVAMLKGLARASGLWRPRPKPPISVGDWRAISRASRASKRVAKAAKSAGYVVTRRGSGRRAAQSPFKRKR
jgi:hypothetical protein